MKLWLYLFNESLSFFSLFSKVFFIEFVHFKEQFRNLSLMIIWLLQNSISSIVWILWNSNRIIIWLEWEWFSNIWLERSIIYWFFMKSSFVKWFRFNFRKSFLVSFAFFQSSSYFFDKSENRFCFFLSKFLSKFIIF